MSTDAHLICMTCKEGIYCGGRHGLFHHEAYLKEVDEFLTKHQTNDIMEESRHNIIYWTEDNYLPEDGLTLDGIKQENHYAIHGILGPVKV